MRKTIFAVLFVSLCLGLGIGNPPLHLNARPDPGMYTVMENTDMGAAISNWYLLTNKSLTGAWDVDSFDYYGMSNSNCDSTYNPATYSCSASQILAPPFVNADQSGMPQNTMHIANLTLCPLGDTDSYFIRLGEVTPGIYEIKFVSKDFYKQNLYVDGFGSGFRVAAIQNTSSAIYKEMWWSPDGTELTHLLLSGGKDSNYMLYRADTLSTYGRSRRANYDMYIAYHEFCPSNVFYPANGWPLVLNPNNTYVMNGLLCNQLPQLSNNGLTPNDPFVDYFRITLTNPTSFTLNTAVITRTYQGDHVPRNEDFKLSMTYNVTNVRTIIDQAVGAATQRYNDSVTLAPGQSQLWNYTMWMNITKNDGDSHVNSTFPQGYQAYQTVIEICNPDRFEGAPGMLTPETPMNIGQFISNASAQWTVSDLTVCPAFGYDLNPKWTTWPANAPDPEQYMVEVKETVPGWATFTVNSNGVCLNISVYPQPINPVKPAFSVAGHTEFRNQWLWSQISTQQTAATAIVGWTEFYRVEVTYCFGSMMPGFASQPANKYDFFRNFTSIPTISYSIGMNFRRYCPQSANLCGGFDYTTARNIGFSSQLNYDFATYNQFANPISSAWCWLCKQGYDTSITSGPEEHWYSFATTSNYTYFSATIDNSWFYPRTTNEYANWPDVALTVFSRQSGTNGAPTQDGSEVTFGTGPTAVQTRYPTSQIVANRDYFVRVKIQNPSFNFPFNNYNLKINLKQCTLDNAEMDNDWPTRYNLTTTNPVFNLQQWTNKYTICGVTPSNNGPWNDIDYYKFNVRNNNGLSDFPGFLNVTLTKGPVSTYVADSELFLNWCDNTTTTCYNATQVPKDTVFNGYSNNWHAVIVQNVSDFVIRVNDIVTSNNWGDYFITIKYDETCPQIAGFSNNNNSAFITSNVLNQIPYMAWTQANSYFGSTSAPHVCINPQVFKFFPQRNSTKYRFTITKQVDWKGNAGESPYILQVQNFERAAQIGSNDDLYTNTAITQPKTYSRLLFTNDGNNLPAYTTNVTLIESSANVKRFISVNYNAMACWQDRFDVNNTANVEVWNQTTGGQQDVLSPRRINKQFGANLDQLTLCFNDDDTDTYTVYVEEFHNEPQAIAKEGFLKLVARSNKQPVNVAWVKNSSKIEDTPCSPQTMTTDGGNTYTTTSYARIKEDYREFYGVTISKTTDANFNQYVWTEYSLQWSFQRKCPIPAWGDNGQLSTAYIIPPAPCDQGSYEWDSGCQMLCEDVDPFEGSKNHYYIIKNDKVQFMNTTITLNTTNRDTAVTCNPTNAAWSALRVTLYINGQTNVHVSDEGYSYPEHSTKFVFFVNGCDLNLNGNTGINNIPLPMGTHYVEVSFLRNTTVNTPNWYRDYRLKISQTYCDCDSSSRETEVVSVQIPNFDGSWALGTWTPAFMNALADAVYTETGTFFGQLVTNTSFGSIPTLTFSFKMNHISDEFRNVLYYRFSQLLNKNVGGRMVYAVNVPAGATAPTPAPIQPANGLGFGKGALIFNAQKSAEHPYQWQNSDMQNGDRSAIEEDVFEANDQCSLNYAPTPQYSCSATQLMAPPFQSPNLGETANAYLVKNLSLCPRGDEDLYVVRNGENVPGIYEIILTSDWFYWDSPIQQGIDVKFIYNGSSAYWKETFNKTREIKSLYLAGGKDRDFIETWVGSNTFMNALKVKGKYNVQVNYHEVCPSNIFFRGAWPLILQPNNTYFINGLLCNGLPYTSGNNPPSSSDDYFRLDFTGAQNVNAPAQAVTVRTFAKEAVPEAEGFQLNILYQSLSYERKRNVTDGTSGTAGLFRDTVQVLNLNNVTYWNYSLSMNTTNKGTASAESVHVNSSYPPGYQSYFSIVDLCTPDIYETDSNKVYNNTPVYIPNNYVVTNTTNQWTINSLTVCPTLGFGSSPSWTTYPMDAPDPEKYIVKLGEQVPGWMNITVNSQNICLNVSINVQPLTDLLDSSAARTTPSVGYRTNFTDLWLWSSLSSTSNKAAVIAGWQEWYQVEIKLCAGASQPWTVPNPQNVYDWFRNFTNIPQITYSIQMDFRRYCPASANPGGFTRQTAVTVPGWNTAGHHQMVSYSTGTNWLCRQTYDASISSGPEEHWWQFTTHLNYTYITTSITDSWFTPRTANMWGNWPDVEISLWTFNSTFPNGKVITSGSFGTSSTSATLTWYPWRVPIDTYFIRVKLLNPRFDFPFSNYKLTVSLIDCTRDEFEDNVDQALFDARSGSFYDDHFDKRANLTTVQTLFNRATYNKLLTICGLAQNGSPVSSNNPALDIDWYNFTLIGSVSNPGPFEFPGFVSVTAISNMGALTAGIPSVTLVTNNTGSDRLCNRLTPASDLDDTRCLRTQDTNKVDFIAQNVSNINFRVQSTTGFWGDYALTITYDQTCPVPFGTNNSNPSNPVRVAENVYWNLVTASKQIGNINTWNTSWLGPNFAPFGCRNPQHYALSASANSTKMRYTVKSVYDWKKDFAYKFQVYLSNETRTLLDVDLNTQTLPYTWSGLLINRPDVVPNSVSYIFKHELIEQATTTKRFIGFDVDSASCPQDRWDINQTNIIELYKYVGGGDSSNISITPFRMNSTTQANVQDVNLCFVDDDWDAYKIYLEDWDGTWNSPAPPGNEGFLIATGVSDKIPLNFQWITPGAGEKMPTNLPCYPRWWPSDAQKNGDQWTTQTWAVVPEVYQQYYTLNVSAKQDGPNKYKFPYHGYNVNWKFQRKCPVPDWGDNNELSKAYAITPPACYNETWSWTTNCQYLCDDLFPYVGDRNHYYSIKNTLPQLLNISLTLTSNSADNTPNKCTLADQTANTAAFRVNLWTDGVAPRTMYVNGCSNNNGAGAAYINAQLPQGTHFIEVTLLKNTTVGGAKWWRDYNLTVTSASYCGCADIAQPSWETVTLSFKKLTTTNTNILTPYIDLQNLLIAIGSDVNVNPQTFVIVQTPTYDNTAGAFINLKVAFYNVDDNKRNSIREIIQQLVSNPERGTALTAAKFQLVSYFKPPVPTPVPTPPTPPPATPQPTVPTPLPQPTPVPPVTTTINNGTVPTNTQGFVEIFTTGGAGAGAIAKLNWATGANATFPANSIIRYNDVPAGPFKDTLIRSAILYSVIIDFALVDSSHNLLSVQSWTQPLQICLTQSVPNGVAPALAYWDISAAKWTIQDASPIISGNMWCGNTTHFTPFAVIQGATQAPTNQPTPQPSGGGGGLSTGAIVGIIIGIIAFIIIVVIVIFIIMSSRSPNFKTELREPMV